MTRLYDDNSLPSNRFFASIYSYWLYLDRGNGVDGKSASASLRSGGRARQHAARAARAIHISQPALTKSIQNLEAEPGVPLLERLPRGVTPTLYGKILFDHAEVLQNHAVRAVAESRAVKEGRGGQRLPADSPC